MSLFFSILYSFSLYLLLSYSFYLIYSIVKNLYITHAMSITMGGYITYFFCTQLSFPFGLSSFLSIFLSILISLAINQFIFKPILNLKIKSWQIMVASLGLYIVLQNIVSIIWGDNITSLRTWEIKVGYKFMEAYITDVQIITIIVSVTLLALCWIFLEKTNTGQQIKAVSSNSELSGIFGISKNNAIVWSFVLATGLAACAGILIAADTDMTPTMGFNWLLYAVVAMIIGGMGKMRYLLLGPLLLATAQHLSAYYLDSKWMNATAYIILIAFLYFRPYGFSGKRIKKAEI